MSQAPNPFTQAASQGYEDFAAYDDQPDGPASPEPEAEAAIEQDEEETPASPPAFTQTQERSYPTADESDEEETPKVNSARRRVLIQNDSDNEEEAETEEKVMPTTFLKQLTMKKRRSEDEPAETKVKRPREEATSDVEDVVENIFGNDVEDAEENDDREEVAAELEDLQTEEVETNNETFNDGMDEDSSDQPKEETSGRAASDALYEIDLFLEKKAEQRRGNRRHGKNGDADLSGPDADRLVKRLLDQMKIAAEEDRIFNKNRQPATAKLLLLPRLEQHLCRAHLTEYFFDNGLFSVMKDWLTPLPDNSLPNIKIRDSLIRLLQQFGDIDTEHLRSSGIGKALMYLYKHPRETKENKLKLIKIIHDWARPIFKLSTDYKVLSREDRERRDADQASLKRQTSQSGRNLKRSADVDLPFAGAHDDDELNKDDDCPRARVPRASTKDYVNRPRSTVEVSEKKGETKRKTISRLDEIKRRQQDQKRQAKPTSIVKLSVEGNRMHL